MWLAKKNDLQNDYKNLVKEIKEHIFALKSDKDVKLCKEWLSKLSDVQKNDWNIRNELLLELKNCLFRKKLTPPFNQSPDSTPLQQLVPKLTLTSTLLSENSDEGGAQATNETVRRYRDKSKEYKMKILEYQTILKNLVGNSLEESDNTSFKASKQPSCDCELMTSTKVKGTEEDLLLERMRALELEMKELREKLSSVSCKLQKNQNASYGRDKERRRRTGRILGKYGTLNNEVSALFLEMRSDLNKTTMQTINEDYSRFEKTALEKCEELEKKYKNILGNLTEEHQKELEDSRQMIEKLQNLLMRRAQDNK